MIIDKVELKRRPRFGGRFDHFLEVTCGNDVFTTPVIRWSPGSGFTIRLDAGKWIEEVGDDLVPLVHVGDDIEIKANFDKDKLTRVRLVKIACHSAV